MISKRLIGTVSESKKYIAQHVAWQWLSLMANIGLMAKITKLIAKLYDATIGPGDFLTTMVIALIAAVIRIICARETSRMNYLSAKAVKQTLREQIYSKLLRLGIAYREQVRTSEVVQLAVEGVEQLEIYFGSFLPQFFYAMLAPLTLFVVLSRINFPSAVWLLLCVPLIPVTIAMVQTLAKKLLAKYWGQYTQLGDTFLENLQGLTTLKIYQADEAKSRAMQTEAERFRRITMKVLRMQLNSITVMDLIAYGGAALGVIIAVTQYREAQVSLAGCLLIILLAAEFFLPMRMLGSYFHVAMNGMSASDQIFRLLDLPEAEPNTLPVPQNCSIDCCRLGFAYESEREILQHIDLTFREGTFSALVGESGCGKSTVAAVLTGRNKGYSGSVTIGGQELSGISDESLMTHLTYIGHNSYLFAGTVKDNLLMGAPEATDQVLWAVLERVKLADFLRSEQGLETKLLEKAANFSGGQRQRLALARALLHDSRIYIFDEATSNIDVESEQDIMQEIETLARTKTVILITHRLANVINADNIYVMDNGCILEQGSHADLITRNGYYAQLWRAQQSLENYAGNEVRS